MIGPLLRRILLTPPMLSALVPLKVVVLTENAGREHREICSSVSRAFQGGPVSSDTGEAYYAAGENLGVAVLEADFGCDESAARAVLLKARKDALHCLVVIVLYDVPGDSFREWLDELDADATTPGKKRNSLGLLVVQHRENLWGRDAQGVLYSSLGEYALRPAYVAAHALATAWRMLGVDQQLKVFVSHAKLDGLPLAYGFLKQITDLHGLQAFYDAKHIPLGANWKEALKEGVQTSVIVALRTNVYEERFWCVQELDWAEDYGCPVVLVDARTQLVRAREFLPVLGAPSAQVPDGNLPRVLQSALREALRVRLFNRQIDELEHHGAPKAKVLRVPRTALSTLGMRCQEHSRTQANTEWVFVPEPFREAHRAVATKLVQAYFPDAWLGTPRAWIERQAIIP